MKLEEARARVREVGGAELVERLDHLDAVRVERARRSASARRSEVERTAGQRIVWASAKNAQDGRGGLGAAGAPRAPEVGDSFDVDVVIAGGGLWSLLAPLLAARGVRVAIVERARVGAAHREWNASGPELRALVRAGLVDDATLEELVVTRYHHGICRFASGGSYPVRGVLDHAVDAGALLRHARHESERLGVEILDGHDVVAHATSSVGVRVYALSTGGTRSKGTGGGRYVDRSNGGRSYDDRNEDRSYRRRSDDRSYRRRSEDDRGNDGRNDDGGGDETDHAPGGGCTVITARVLVDARGAASPYATADLVCPTVGGVMRGLRLGSGPDEIDPRVGEILATVDTIEDGRQHVWEAFPGRAGETTVYLFYYARSGERTSLTELYARFFETLPRYKRGDARLVRPTFGFIPGWSRLSPAPRADDPRVVLVGDAAARHSPLTYCGFGATLRSLARCADDIAKRLESSRDTICMHDTPIHALTGALAHMMASRAFVGDELNALLDAAFETLHELGDAAYGELLRDEMNVFDFVRFLRATARRHPRVWGEVARGLGFLNAGRWGLGLAREAIRAHP